MARIQKILGELGNKIYNIAAACKKNMNGIMCRDFNKEFKDCEKDCCCGACNDRTTCPHICTKFSE